MVAARAQWAFTSGLAPTLIEGPTFTASSVEKALSTSTATISASGGRLNHVPRLATDTDTEAARAQGFVITVGPPAGQEWTPGTLTYTTVREGGSGGQYTRVAVVGGVQLRRDIMSTGAQTLTASLASLGPRTTPLSLVFWGNNGGSTVVHFYDNIEVTGTYEIAGATDQTVGPVGELASGEAFGVPAVTQLLRQVVSPPSIGSDESFGVPSVVVLQSVRLTVEAIASGEAFGAPQVFQLGPGLSPYPDGAAVAEFLGSPDDDTLIALATVHVGVITHFARVYARGNGFRVEGVANDIAAVILAATARLVANPEQLDITVGSMRRATGFKGWSLAERAVLNQYRRVAR